MVGLIRYRQYAGMDTLHAWVVAFFLVVTLDMHYKS